MISARTPFRVTLGGGGTDLPSYADLHGGLIVATAINQYMHVGVHRPRYDTTVRLHHPEVETGARVADLRHDLAREALRLHGIHDRVQLVSMADLPSGTGLGSSACYLVALLAALQSLHNPGEGHENYPHGPLPLKTRTQLAEQAFALESMTLGRVLGRQDPYMAALGGLTVLELGRDGSVQVQQLTKSRTWGETFAARTHLYYTGHRRDALEVLADQAQAMTQPEHARRQDVETSLHRIKALGYQILEALQNDDFDRWGQLLHTHWEAKKQLSARVSLRRVDELYDEVRARFGVLGGKISGAGGGGFLMLYCPHHGEALEAFMQAQGMPRLPYALESEGVTLGGGFAGPGWGGAA